MHDEDDGDVGVAMAIGHGVGNMNLAGQAIGGTMGSRAVVSAAVPSSSSPNTVKLSKIIACEIKVRFWFFSWHALLSFAGDATRTPWACACL